MNKEFIIKGCKGILHYDEDISMWVASHDGIGGAIVRGETRQKAIDTFLEAMMLSRACLTLMHFTINNN